MSEREIENKYERAFAQAASVHPVFPTAAKEQMAQMVEEMARSYGHIDNITSTNQSAAVKGGYVAEEYQSATFNLDAILKGDNARAYTDRDPQWGEHTWMNGSLKRNDTPDVIVSRDGRVSTTAQSKYYDTPENTASHMSQVKDGKPKYGELDQLIGPSDQVNPKGDVVSIREHAEAKASALKNTKGDPAEIQAYEQTAQKNSAVLKDGKSSSTPLTKGDAERMGSGDKSPLKRVENTYKTRSTLQQMGNAAIGAAAMSAIIAGSVNVCRYVQMAREGKLSPTEATLKIIAETSASAADSALKASANVGVQSLMVRYGSQEAAMAVLAKQGMKSMLRTNAATVGVICAVDAVKDLVRLGMGNISEREFYERQGKNFLGTSAGVMGGTVGIAAGNAVAASMGVAAGTAAMSAAAVVGGLAGGLIGGLAMQFAIDNGIEKPYRELVQNTKNLHDATVELERASRTVFKSQILFTKFIEADAHMEIALQDQLKRIDDAGQRALDAINRI